MAEADDQDDQHEAILDAINSETFARWRHRQDYRDNIEDGHPEYNSGGYRTEDTRHSPHTLLQCPRKQWYRDHTAPQETPAPAGIFTVGSYLEENVLEPFLAEKAKEHDLYMQNSMWVEGDVSTMDKTLKIRGSTDPVFVEEDGTPVLVTECKSKYTGAGVEEPLQHHAAQLAAYQFALAQTHDIDPPPGVIVYIGRKDLEIAEFPQTYDPGLVADIITWMEDMTECRVQDVLPPDEPMHEADDADDDTWDECYTCAFRERCGRGEEPWSDVRETGFIPLMEYPRSEVLEYLRAHGGKVTPTLAAEYPDVADEYGVLPWVCEACGSEYEFGRFDWSGDTSDRPACPSCASNRAPVELRGPDPTNQPTDD